MSQTTTTKVPTESRCNSGTSSSLRATIKLIRSSTSSSMSTTMKSLSRSSSMRVIPEGSEEEQRIRHEWDVRRSLSNFIKTTYNPPKYKLNNSILSEIQQGRETDEETEPSEEDTEVEEEEEEELETPKILDTGIRIVGYLLKDGTYIKSMEDVFKPRPSLASITEVPFRFEFPSSQHKEVRNKIEGGKACSGYNEKEICGNNKHLHKSKNDKYDNKDSNMNNLSKSHMDNLQCLGRTDYVNNIELWDENNLYNRSRRESLSLHLSLQNLTMIDKDVGIFKNSSDEKLNEPHFKVKDRIAKLEKRLSDSFSSPDEAEIDFASVFSQEEKKIDNKDVNCTKKISKNKEHKSVDGKQEVKKNNILRESTRQMLSFISDVHSKDKSKTQLKSETEVMHVHKG